jgi:hypothetical protein
MKRSSWSIPLLLFASPAVCVAAEHLMTIQEVFVGPPGDALNPALTPDQRAQYVMLLMTSSGQTVVNTTYLRVEDADGNLLGRFGTFTANVANGGTLGCAYPNCPAILIGTQAAKNLFSFTFNQIVDAQAGRVALPRAGGRVCFLKVTAGTLIDCVAWGNFDCTRSGSCTGANTPRTGDTAANTCDTNFGTPASAATGLIFGRSLRRTAFVCAANENSTQLTQNPPTGFPHPVNNAGSSDNVDADADGLIDRLDCADADATIWWGPTEVQGLSVTGGLDATLAWSGQAGTAGPGVTYDVVRGGLASLSGLADAGCFAPDTPLTNLMDGTALLPGELGFYYLFRASSGAACPGTYGTGRSAVDPICP